MELNVTERGARTRATHTKDAVEAAIDIVKEDRTSTWVGALRKRPNRIARWDDDHPSREEGQVKSP